MMGERSFREVYSLRYNTVTLGAVEMAMYSTSERIITTIIPITTTPAAIQLLGGGESCNVHTYMGATSACNVVIKIS